MVLALLLVSGLAGAASLPQERDKLARYEQAYENYLVDIEDIENEIYGYEEKIKGANKDLKEAENDLKEDTKELTEARKALQAEKSQHNQRQLKLAAHAHKMSKRGIRTRSKRLERLEERLSELQQELSVKQGGAKRAKQRISAQERRVAQVLSYLKNQARTSSPQIVAKPSPPREEVKLQPKLVSIPPAPAQPARQASAQAPRQQAQEALEEMEDDDDEVLDTEALEHDDDEVLDTEALEHVRREMARLQKLLSRGNKGRPTFKHLILEGVKSPKRVKFEFLGKNQYRAEARVEKGKQLFEVGSNKFRRTIPESDDNEVYVFIYDAKRLSRPRLVIFNKALMEYL
ncbi:MAG: hypothetical protein P8Y42_20595 [Exilibacterium sp.]